MYVESALAGTAIQSPPAVMVDLIVALEQKNPKSKYLDEAYGPYLVALEQDRGRGEDPGVAEKALANFPENEDLLLYDDRDGHDAGSRPTVPWVTPTASPPCSIDTRSRKAWPAADWERKRSAALARGYWVAGVISAEKGVWVAADKNLRADLPLIQGTGRHARPGAILPRDGQLPAWQDDS